MMPRADLTRWGLCFAVVVAAHAAGAAALMARWSDDELAANPPVITVDLAPMAVAPEIVPNDMPTGPPQVETPPEVEPPPPPPPQDVSVEPPKPPEPPKKPPEKKKIAKLTTAPTPAEHRAPVAAAPSAGAAGNSSALPNWKSLLVATLERNKRYPSDARSRGEQGVAQLAFSVDRSGGVHNARIVRSSGSSALDNETLALAQRAAPLPAPPPELPGASISISVPIRYNMH